MIRWLGGSLIMVTLFLGVNFSWTHAALAGLSTDNGTCPDQLISQAAQRVSKLFGKTRSSPWFVCLNEARLGLTVSHGTARFAPLLPTIVVLGPKGQNADVAAHEFAHAEIAARTSALLRSYVVPTWFDEGLAMQLDHRADYKAAALLGYISAGHLENVRLKELSWPSGFYRSGQQGKAHYALAKCVVAHWLQREGRAGVPAMLSDVSWSSTFPSAQFNDELATCLATQG